MISFGEFTGLFIAGCIILGIIHVILMNREGLLDRDPNEIVNRKSESKE